MGLNDHTNAITEFVDDILKPLASLHFIQQCPAEVHETVNEGGELFLQALPFLQRVLARLRLHMLAFVCRLMRVHSVSLVMREACPHNLGQRS